MTEPTTIKEVLQALLQALEDGNQEFYASMWRKAEQMHKDAAKAIRKRKEWTVPHP